MKTRNIWFNCKIISILIELQKRYDMILMCFSCLFGIMLYLKQILDLIY